MDTVHMGVQNGDAHPVPEVSTAELLPSVEVTRPAQASTTPSPPPASRQLSLARIALFGLAGPPLQMTGNISAFYFSIFLLEVAHLSPALVSIISFSGRAWDAVTDPVIGQLLSRTNTKWGKTKPWIFASSIVGCAVHFFMWWPLGTGVETQGVKFAYYLVMHLAYCTLITCYHIPYTSATVLLSEVPADRDAATASRIVCELLFTIIGSAVFGYVIGSKRIAVECRNSTLNGTNVTAYAAELHRIVDEQNSYRIAAGIISGIFLTCGMIGTFGIRERLTLTNKDRENVFRNILQVVKFKPYLALMLAFLFLSLGIQTIQANLGLFTTHRLKMGWHMTFGFMCILTMAALCVPLVHLLNRQLGKKKVFIIGVIFGFPCILLTQMIETNNLILYYIVTCLSGTIISVAMLQPWSMLPDVIEAFHRCHGNRKEATFYSLYAFFTKFAAGISLAVSQMALWLSDYDSNSCEQPTSVAITLRWLMGPGPAFCLLISAIIMVLWYPSAEKLRAFRSRDCPMIPLLQNGCSPNASDRFPRQPTEMSLTDKGRTDLPAYSYRTL